MHSVVLRKAPADRQEEQDARECNRRLLRLLTSDDDNARDAVEPADYGPARYVEEAKKERSTKLRAGRIELAISRTALILGFKG